MGSIERKGSEDLAKSGAPAVDQSNLGQAPRTFVEPRGFRAHSAEVASATKAWQTWLSMGNVVPRPRVFTS